MWFSLAFGKGKGCRTDCLVVWPPTFPSLVTVRIFSGLTGLDFISRHGVVSPYNCIDSGHVEALILSNFVIPTTGELIMTGLCLWFFARPIALIKGGRYFLGLYTGGGVACNAACLLWSKFSSSRNIDESVSKARGTCGSRGATSTVYGYSILFNLTGTVLVWGVLPIRMALVPFLFWGPVSISV